MEIKQSKRKIVIDYLQDEFPDCTIEEKYDFDFCAQTFKISKYPIFHLLKIDEDYFIDNDESKIASDIQKWKIADYLRKVGKQPIFVSNKGPELLKKT